MGCMPMIIQLWGVVARAEGKRSMRTLPFNSPTITLGLTHPLFVIIINTCSLFMSNSHQNLPLCFYVFLLASFCVLITTNMLNFFMHTAQSMKGNAVWDRPTCTGLSAGRPTTAVLAGRSVCRVVGP